MKKIKKRRQSRGSSILELVVAIPVLIIVTALSIDLAVLMFGIDICDRTCRDCARAAGQMATPDDAVNAMNAAAQAHNIDGFVINKVYPELLVYEDYNYSAKYPTPKYGRTSNYLGNNGPGNAVPTSSVIGKNLEKVDYTDPDQTSSPGPYVVVRTNLLMRIPVMVDFFGLKLATTSEQDPQLFKVQSLYTFPITNVYTPN